MERNFLLTIEYDGTGFSGWQRQPDKPTVQGTLEKALSTVLGREIRVNGTSRTDAGVHAYGQRASFKGDFGIPTEKLAMVVNNRLAGGLRGKTGVGAVRIVEAVEMPSDFHARFDSKGKTYVYRIRNVKEMDIFQRNYCYQIPDPLDVEAMKRAASFIEGTHDFACFQAAGGEERETTVRTVFQLLVEKAGTDVYIIITGDGFLYNMVRIITGTLVEVGLGKRSPESVAETIVSCDRQKAGHTAPPQGLYLKRIYYDMEEVPGYGNIKTSGLG